MDNTNYHEQNLLLPPLRFLRMRVTMRLLADAQLPSAKGGMLRGGFGYMFQRASCPPSCWSKSNHCPAATPCAYRQIFETPHPPHIAHLHNLRDVPRPFVIAAFDNQRTHYRAGDVLEFLLLLLGQGIDYLPYFFFGFEELGRVGLGKNHTRAHLERVEAMMPWSSSDQVLYRDGRVIRDIGMLPIASLDSIQSDADALSSDLLLTLQTPLRLKYGGEWLRRIDPAALVQAICWRLHALNIFHGETPWEIDHRGMVEQARLIRVEQETITWHDQTRISKRSGQPQQMHLGGLMGTARVHDISPALRTLLLAGSLVHVGKACVFGNGSYTVQEINNGQDSAS